LHNLRINEPFAGFKTILDRSTGRILGAHLLDSHADDLINLFALAMQHNLTAADIKQYCMHIPLPAPVSNIWSANEGYGVNEMFPAHERPQSFEEEIANGISHGIALVACLVATPFFSVRPLGLVTPGGLSGRHLWRSNDLHVPVIYALSRSSCEQGKTCVSGA